MHNNTGMLWVGGEGCMWIPMHSCTSTDAHFRHCSLSYHPAQTWDPLFALDVGEPLDLCSESKDHPMVFSRTWTKGVASLDCNTYTASLPFSTLDLEYL